MAKVQAEQNHPPSVAMPTPLQGAFWMSADAGFFAVMINLVRLLTDYFDPLQVVFFRAVLIIRPGVAVLDPVALLAIVTALVWGSSTVLLKYMSRSKSTSAMVIYMPLSCIEGRLPCLPIEDEMLPQHPGPQDYAIRP